MDLSNLSKDTLIGIIKDHELHVNKLKSYEYLVYIFYNTLLDYYVCGEHFESIFQFNSNWFSQYIIFSSGSQYGNGCRTATCYWFACAFFKLWRVFSIDLYIYFGTFQ